jgi:hypothetical protein
LLFEFPLAFAEYFLNFFFVRFALVTGFQRRRRF